MERHHAGSLTVALDGIYGSHDLRIHLTTCHIGNDTGEAELRAGTKVSLEVHLGYGTRLVGGIDIEEGPILALVLQTIIIGVVV